MKLVASPFEDDVDELLEWLYGRGALITYARFRNGGEQRVGQAFMNTLFVYDPQEYARLAGSIFDPFYVDNKIPAALDKLTSK